MDTYKFNIVNIYTPNTVTEQKVFFERLRDYFLSQGDLIIGGNFNCIANPLDHMLPGVKLPDKKNLQQFMIDFSLL